MPANKVYQIVSDKIVAAITGAITSGNPIAPWRKPWHAYGMEPRNAYGKPYRGINMLLLSFSGYSNPYWLTYNKAVELGGQVRKGEKSTLVTFWKRLQITGRDANTNEEVEKNIPLLRYFLVFNAEQIDNLPAKYATVEPTVTVSPNSCAETTIAYMQNAPIIKYGGARAFYAPALDSVTIPKINTFDSADAFYATTFHELGHSTGHKSRLNRPEVANCQPFGSEDYSKEELTAEFTSAFLSAHCGIDNSTLPNSVAYLNNWLSRLQANPDWLVSAAAKAQKAADYILNVKWENE
jgi:antirestriction protein ArdC